MTSGNVERRSGTESVNNSTMSMIHPEEHFRRGVAALAGGKPVRAVAHFQEALQEEERQAPVRPQMRYLSYYGLALSVAYKPTHESIDFCERAARTDSFDAELQANLAKVYLLAGKRSKALAALVRGIRLDPAHKRLHALFEKVDRRRKPLIPTLGRNHFVNRTAGRLRARLAR